MITCNNCGWVHFSVTREYAENEVRKFNEFFNTLSLEDKFNYGNRLSSIHQYEICYYCGGSYLNFRESMLGDCPDGCTLNPIIKE